MSDTVLAVDASADSCSVALSHAGHLYEAISREPRAHAQRLLPMIDELMTQASIGLRELSYIALVNGPGSFTGIRIALSICQGLAYGATLPILPVNSLVTMARQVQLNSSASGLIVTALDARMGEVYWAAYELDEDQGVPIERIPPSVAPIEVFISGLRELAVECSREICLAGSAVNLMQEQLSQLDLGHVLPDIAPAATALLSLAQDLQPQAQNFSSAATIEPLYLRNEVAWVKRQRIRQPK